MVNQYTIVIYILLNVLLMWQVSMYEAWIINCINTVNADLAKESDSRENSAAYGANYPNYFVDENEQQEKLLSAILLLQNPKQPAGQNVAAMSRFERKSKQLNVQNSKQIKTTTMKTAKIMASNKSSENNFSSQNNEEDQPVNTKLVKGSTNELITNANGNEIPRKVKRELIKSNDKLMKHKTNKFDLYYNLKKSVENVSDDELNKITIELFDAIDSLDTMVNIQKGSNRSEAKTNRDMEIKNLSGKLKNIVMKYFKGDTDYTIKSVSNEELENISREMSGLLEAFDMNELENRENSHSNQNASDAEARLINGALNTVLDSCTTLGVTENDKSHVEINSNGEQQLKDPNVELDAIGRFDINKDNNCCSDVNNFSDEELQTITGEISDIVGELHKIEANIKENDDFEIQNRKIAKKIPRNRVQVTSKELATTGGKKQARHYTLLHLKEMAYKRLLNDLQQVATLRRLEKDINDPLVQEQLAKLPLYKHR